MPASDERGSLLPERRLPGFLTPSRLRAVSHGLVLVGLGFAVFLVVVLMPARQTFGIDAYAYWLVDLAGPYDIPHRTVGSFPYSPPAAIVASTFSLLPWWVFLWLWTALVVASVIWIGGSLGWIVVAFAIPAVTLEIYHGNIHILMAVAVLLGFRHPWTWSFILLTKFTCGVGLLWFVVRREWRSLGIALGATAVLAGVSLVFLEAPQDRSSPNAIGIPLLVRLPIAALLVIWGARTDRRWTVIVAVALSLPVIWLHGLAILVGLLGEIEHRGGTPASRAVERLRGRFATSA